MDVPMTVFPPGLRRELEAFCESGRTGLFRYRPQIETVGVAPRGGPLIVGRCAPVGADWANETFWAREARNVYTGEGLGWTLESTLPNPCGRGD